MNVGACGNAAAKSERAVNTLTFVLLRVDVPTELEPRLERHDGLAPKIGDELSLLFHIEEHRRRDVRRRVVRRRVVDAAARVQKEEVRGWCYSLS